MFTTVDTVLIIILSVLFIYGFFKGFISMTIPIIAIIITLIAAPLIYNYMSKYFDHSFILKIISLIASYSIIRIILSKIEINFKKVLKAIFLDWVDRLLGALVVLFISCLIIAIIVSLMKSLDTQYNDIINQSKIATYIYNIFSKSNYSLIAYF
ncbi:CvpA family protein [uncultured Brachyspira sp.]|uniref:CvpA family protein n=1 Tax=uncultured Brachyspira sp. TaxID=221953 RepID=UPI002608DE3C|nr:CvpA family protein [uncultured Brachyspira sp.]